MFEQLKSAGKRFLRQEIATRTTDPNFYSALNYLPNPDPILRKIGKSEEVYDAIFYDAHVLGELRSVRAGLLGYEWRLQAGGDSSADMAALELCEKVFSQNPAPGMQWPDLIWNISKAVFKGYQVHEVVWKPFDRYLLPVKIEDRPQRRFIFSTDNQPRLLTKENRIDGDALTPYKWLLTRHMPDYDNPYGVALFSSCFWPYTFKHSGFKYFVKFCEKYGIPWAIGKYPEGTPPDQQDALADALAQMVEDAVAAIPGDGSVELLQTSVSGEIVQERLVNLCNREMSKALTSQTLATEIQGQGSRAAAETHSAREDRVNDSDRYVTESTLNELLRWITEINIAGANPPTFEFYEEAEARKEWVEVIDGSRSFLQIPKRFAHERLQIPMPEEGEDVLPSPSSQASAEFSQHCPHCHDYAGKTDQDNVDKLIDQAAQEADKVIEANIDDIKGVLDHYINVGLSLDDFIIRLETMYPAMDKTKLHELSRDAMAATALVGMDEAEN